MIALSFGFIYGMSVGIIFMDEEDKVAHECEWGFVIMLGIINVQFVKH